AMAVDARASPQLRREVTLGGCRDACEDREQDELVEGRLVAEARAEGLDVLRLDLGAVEDDRPRAGELLAEAVPVVEDRHALLLGAHAPRDGGLAAPRGRVGPVREDRARRVELAALHHEATLALDDDGLLATELPRADLAPRVAHNL